MGTSVAELLVLVRALIPEATAVDWPNERLLVHLNKEHRDWAAALGRLPGPGWFTVDATFTLVANATTYALTGLLTASQGKFAALKSVYYVPESGDEVEIDSASPGQENLWRLPVGQSPVGQQAPDRRWLTRPAGVPTINFGPESSVARSFRTLVRYEPPLLTESDDAQTDPRHDDVLVRGTVLRALEEVGEDDGTIERRYQSDKLSFLEDERMAAGESCSETTKVVVSDAMFG